MRTLAEQTPIHPKAGHVYVAGPMAGKEDHGFPAFQAATELLRLHLPGVVVRSPHQGVPTDVILEIDRRGRDTPGYHAAIRRDVCMLLECEAVILLDGWGESNGANLECRIADMTGAAIFELRTLTTQQDWANVAAKLSLPTPPTPRDLVHPYVD